MNSNKKKGDRGEVHHIPSKDSVRKGTSLNPRFTPAILMTVADHAKTASNGKQGVINSAIYRKIEVNFLKNNQWCEAIEMGVEDVRSINPIKYQVAITQMQLSLPVLIGRVCVF